MFPDSRIPVKVSRAIAFINRNKRRVFPHCRLHDVLRNTVVSITHEARLLAGYLAEPLLRAVRAALLQLPTVLFEFAANRLNLLTRIRVALAIGCDLDYAEVNPKNTARHIGRRWFGLLDSDGEVIRTVTKKQVGFARSHIRSEWRCVGSFEFGPLLAAVPHHEVFAPLRGGERNAGQVLAFVTTRVENYRRTLAENAADELVFLVRVGDNVDGASGECGANPLRVFLGGQTGLFTNGVISRVMAVGSTKGSGVPGDARLSENRGDSRQMVVRLVEAFHRVGECRLLGCHTQLESDDFHDRTHVAHIVSQKEAYYKSSSAFSRRKSREGERAVSSPAWTTKRSRLCEGMEGVSTAQFL